MNIPAPLKILGIIAAAAIVLYGISLLVMLSQVTRYKNYWEKNNQQAAAAGEILYVSLGDSTAQGIGATSPEKGYPGIIRKTLQERTGQPVKLVNLSKSGAVVRSVIDTQLPALEKQAINDQTIITIEIGANNMINFEVEKFTSEMDEMMSKLPKQTLISDLPYFGGGRFKSKQPNVLKANEIMYSLADKHGFKLVPLHERTKSNNNIKTYAPDLFHPSNYGYSENWAPVFLESIKQAS